MWRGLGACGIGWVRVWVSWVHVGCVGGRRGGLGTLGAGWVLVGCAQGWRGGELGWVCMDRVSAFGMIWLCEGWAV